MQILGIFIFVIYFLCLVYISFYCLMQFHLLVKYRKARKSSRSGCSVEKADWDDYPFITIQLPIFNEYYVVERLIDNICALDYPRERFEIHVLDDSTDETVNLSRAKAEAYADKGFQIQVITREARTGYKAGALRDAMPYAKGEFIAIFDADFLPNPDFLKKTLPYFKDKRVGVVQTRWGHINQSYSLITELQAFQLNVHFTVEQKGREQGNYLLQFNGTAGVWRRHTIEDAGGWEADTLTEDLDLSYRAQLKDWKIVYLEDVCSPAELPSEMIGLKSQQYRWMKGGAETARKLLPQVWSSKNLSLSQKVLASSHLLASSVFLFVFLLGLFSVPLLFVFNPLNQDMELMSFFLVSLIAIIAVYYVANVEAAWDKENKLKSIFKFIVIFPAFLAMSMGLSLHNSIAVVQGYLGRKSAFVRTPKFNIKSLRDSFRKKKYRQSKISWLTAWEGILAIYFLMAFVYGIFKGDGSLLIFHFLLFAGYSSIFYYSIKHLNYQNR